MLNEFASNIPDDPGPDLGIATGLRHQNQVVSVAFSPDGRWLASGGFDELLRIWDGNIGKLCRTLGERREQSDYQSCVASLTFHPSSNLLAVVSPDAHVRIRETDVWQEVLTIEEPRGVSEVLFSPDCVLVAMALYDEAICLWDLWGRSALEYVEVFSRPNALTFSPDGSILAYATEDPAIRLVEIASRRIVGSLYGHSGEIHAISFAPDGNALASVGEDKKIMVWALDSLSCKGVIEDSAGLIYTLEFSPDGTHLAWGNGTGAIRLWQLRTWAAAGMLVGHHGIIRALCYSRRRNWLASGGCDHTVRVWDIANQRQVF
jgi:WD40 repeat protein